MSVQLKAIHKVLALLDGMKVPYRIDVPGHYCNPPQELPCMFSTLPAPLVAEKKARTLIKNRFRPTGYIAATKAVPIGGVLQFKAADFPEIFDSPVDKAAWVSFTCSVASGFRRYYGKDSYEAENDLQKSVYTVMRTQ